MSEGSAPKRFKRDAEEEANREIYSESAMQQSLEDIDSCQNQIDILTEKASEDILKVEQKYNKLRKPYFEKRNNFIQNIKNFWATAIVNHPHLSPLIHDEEEDCLAYLYKLDVEEFEDIKFGYRIKFYFEPNPYFQNEVLTKEFHLGSPVPSSRHGNIRWKEGKNIIKLIKERRIQKQGKKADPDVLTFFTWYEENGDPAADEIAEVIKDDLWTNPLQYYLSPDIELGANGVDDDDNDDEGSDGSDDDSDGDSVILMDDIEVETIDDEEDEDEVMILEQENVEGSRAVVNEAEDTENGTELDTSATTSETLTTETSGSQADIITIESESAESASSETKAQETQSKSQETEAKSQDTESTSQEESNPQETQSKPQETESQPPKTESMPPKTESKSQETESNPLLTEPESQSKSLATGTSLESHPSSSPLEDSETTVEPGSQATSQSPSQPSTTISSHNPPQY